MKCKQYTVLVVSYSVGNLVYANQNRFGFAL